jgi:predicted RNA binding protein YcfA (HicA-like mRNA interferase family)
MKPVSGRRMCELLSQRGWSLIRISGSHRIHTRAGPPRQIVSVPVHGNKDLKPKTQRNIMRAAGLSDDDL